jgi:arsenate reductase
VNETVLFHNSACSKSRAALDLLRAHGIEPRIVDYRKTPPAVEELRSLVALLGVPAHALVRDSDAGAAAAGLADAGSLPEEDMIRGLHAHPGLLQRPILVHGGHALIARPPERVLEVVGKAR